MLSHRSITRCITDSLAESVSLRADAEFAINRSLSEAIADFGDTLALDDWLDRLVAEFPI